LTAVLLVSINVYTLMTRHWQSVVAAWRPANVIDIGWPPAAAAAARSHSW